MIRFDPSNLQRFQGEYHIGVLIANEEDEDDCDVVDKVSILTFIYTGEDCTATSHQQDPGKVSCNGDSAFAQPVEVVIVKDGKNGFPIDHKYTVTPASVNVNQTLTIARNDGKNFGAKIIAHILENGNVLQEVEFHTSCSQPLAVGDQFGSLEVIDLDLVPK